MFKKKEEKTHKNPQRYPKIPDISLLFLTEEKEENIARIAKRCP